MAQITRLGLSGTPRANTRKIISTLLAVDNAYDVISGDTLIIDNINNGILANDTYNCAGAIKMLTFDGTTTYGELGSSITFAGNFEIEVVFSTTDTFNQILIGDDYTNSLYFNMGGGDVSIWDAGQTNNFDTTTNPVWDGKLHTIKYVRASGVYEVFIDGNSKGTWTPATSYTGANNFVIGSSNSNPIFFDGIIKSVKLTDLATPANSRTYTLDSGSILYESDDGGASTNMRLNYFNVVAEDWGSYTYNATSDDCAGGPGWESNTGGTTICVA